MDKEIVVALIVAASGILGSGITLLTTYITKVLELKMIDEQKRNEAYTEELRRRIDTVYVPLNAAINKLTDQYDEFVKTKHSLSQHSSFEKTFEQLEESAYKFKDACKECVIHIRAPWHQGVNPWLTLELARELDEFRNLLGHAEVRDTSFSRSEDFSIFIKQGYTFTGKIIPIISSVFDERFKHHEVLIQAQFRAAWLGKSLRFYPDSIQKKIEDANKELKYIGYTRRS